MNVAIIPARGGSKRIPRKNVKLFAGRPMIAHAIEAARASELFDRVVVSTDDDEIAAIAKQHGAEVPFMRPADLADDHTPTAPVIAHALSALEEAGATAIDYLCCIYPGVPFLKMEDLAAGLDLLQKRGSGYTFPVAAYPAPIQRALKMAEDGSLQSFEPRHALTRTQDLEPAFFDAGQFYWGAAETWRTAGPIHADAHGLLIPEWRVVDIDTPADWERAERLYRAYGTEAPE